jgi:hypothetical protein
MSHLLDDDELEVETWRVITALLPDLEEQPIPGQVSIQTLFEPSMYRKLATWFLQRRMAGNDSQFLHTDQLRSIAGRNPQSEIDIDETPGVYVFCSLTELVVLKVGQSGDLRQRIACEHLRKECMNTDSLLIDYARRHWSVPSDAEWHESLREHEVTALLFPMPRSEEPDRLIVEVSLTGTLHPWMP